MILSPEEATAVKRAIDIAYPSWRTIGCERTPDQTPAESPGIIVVSIDGARHAVTAGSSTVVFGAGHLGVDTYWADDGIGCAVKGDVSALDAAGVDEIVGFIHLSRHGQLGFGQEGPDPEARFHFEVYDGEHSAFYPVTFRRSADPNPRYPWRAYARHLSLPPASP